ncbi:MAG: T9SS type A sorting domain-containing protein [Bacteroidetes bacterium]|nr:T9SS type A sorting domain-containing protein [Bacteroidota bacterium]
MKSIFILLLCLFFNFSTFAQWVLQHIGYELPGIGTFLIEVIDDNTLWTTSYDPVIANTYQLFSRTNNGGNTWNPGYIPGYVAYRIQSISAISYSCAWVILKNPDTDETQALETTDGGNTWQERFPCATGSDRPDCIHFWNVNEGVCAGLQSPNFFEIYTTSDCGLTWMQVYSPDIPSPLSNGEIIYFSTHAVIGNTIWVGTSRHRVLKSVDKGLHWTVSTPPYPLQGNLPQVEFLNSEHGITRVPSYGYAETFDGGTTWSLFSATGTLPQGGNNGALSWIPGSANTIIGTNDGIHYSFDGGHTWSQFDTLQTKHFTSETAWVNNSTGWVGDVTEMPNPSQTGIWKFTGTLNAILEMDPGQGGVTFYPNPCKDLVNMVLAGFLGEDVVLDIFNLQGQKVYTAEFHQTLIQSDRKIDLSFLKSGTYVASVRSGKKCLVKKIVVEE